MSDLPEDKTDLTDAWTEWHKFCHLEKCSEKNRKDLCTVGNRIFCKILKDFSAYFPPIPHFSPSEFMSFVLNNETFSFSLMETYLLPEDEEERRKYKDSKFKGRKPGEVTGYFFKSFFKSYIRDMIDEEEREKKRRLNNYFVPEDGKDNNEEWLETVAEKHGVELNPKGDSGTTIDENELEEAARKTAQNFFFRTITRTDRIALWAWFNDIPLDQFVELEIVKLGQSAFYARPRKLIERYSNSLWQQEEQLRSSQEREPGAREMNMAEKTLYLKVSVNVLRDCAIQWEAETNLGKSLASDPRIKKKGKKTE